MRIISTVLTGVMTGGRTLTVELVPREALVHPGDAVVWFNGVPGAMLGVAFDSPPAAVENCSPTIPIRAHDSSRFLRPGEARIVCFLQPGRFPFRAVIATADAAITLKGVVIVYGE